MVLYFYATFLATVVCTRVFLYLRPTSSPKIKGFQTHHYMHGIVGVIIGVVFNYMAVFSIGLGLFIDELTAFVLMRGKTHEDNYSRISLFGTAAFVFLVFLTREQWLNLYNSF